MAKSKKIRETFNDGYITYGHKGTVRNELGQDTGDEAFIVKGKLAYKEISCREEDYQMASFMSATLSFKLKTLFPPSFRNVTKNKLKIIKDGIEFHVIKVDPDREKSCLYFYLQEVGPIGQHKVIHE